MANRYVRLYEGPEDSTIIGFSFSAAPTETEDLQRFLNERGYETHEYDWMGDEADPRDKAVIHKLGGVSFVYLGVRPPLSGEHVNEFASWCMENVDPYHNSGLLIDNRNSRMPLEPFSGGKLIERW